MISKFFTTFYRGWHLCILSWTSPKCTEHHSSLFQKWERDVIGVVRTISNCNLANLVRPRSHREEVGPIMSVTLHLLFTVNRMTALFHYLQVSLYLQGLKIWKYAFWMLLNSSDTIPKNWCTFNTNLKVTEFSSIRRLVITKVFLEFCQFDATRKAMPRSITPNYAN